MLWDEGKLYRSAVLATPPFYKAWLVNTITSRLEKKGRKIMEPMPSQNEARIEGKDWPPLAHTMIGLKRLNNLQVCIEDVLRSGTPGDLIETGVWRGGATIFMRAVLKAYDVVDRRVWVADSFQGLPPPDDNKYPWDKGADWHTVSELRVSLEEVRANFERYGLLDDQVEFLKGWFKDTLPKAPIDTLAILRVDGDMYESTWDALVNLYPKLSSGGFCIVDDYCIENCRRAVNDYRSQYDIRDEIFDIDGSGIYWRSTKISDL